MDFMTKIRKNSGALHKAAESNGFIKRIVDGNASTESYCEYLFNLSAMYKCIESTLNENVDNDVIKDFVTLELYRSDLIEKDLEFLVGDKTESMELLPSTIAFVNRINDLRESNPELVVAHAYTRFLADLFGGRTFESILGKKYNIPTEGLNYYSCDKIKDIRSYVMNYGSKLNAIDLDDDSKNSFINEISNSYIYNIAISTELEAKLYSSK